MADSPGGQEVGRVSIRVVPDTSRFRRELKDQLEALPDTDYEFDAKGNVDEKQLAREVRSAARAAGASVDIDAQFRKSALDQIQQYGKQLTAAGKDLDLIQDATKGLVTKIGLEVDPRSKKTWRDDINEELSSLRGLALDLTPRLDEQGTRDLKARVEALKVPVKVEVDRRSLSRTLGSITAGIANSLSSFMATAKIGAQAVQSDLAGLAKGFRGAANAASRFGEAGAIVAAVLAFTAPALSLLTGALVAAPAALAAFAVPAGAIALGLEGIKKAAETAAPALEKLKAAVSDTFATDLLPGFEEIRDRLLPGITEGMKGVAASLSTMFNGVVDTLASPEGLNNIQTTIDNVAKSISMATPGLQSFTDGLNTLIAKLSGGFPGVADWFNNLGADFSGWIDKITANGELDTAMKNLKDTLGEIGGALGDIAKWSWDNLANEEFGDKMRQFAADLRAIINDLLPLLKSGFEDIADIINGIVTAIDKIKGAANWFEKITGGKQPEENIGKQPDTSNFFEPFTSDEAPWRSYLASATETVNAIKAKFLELWNSLKANAALGITGLVTLFTNLPTQLSNAFLTVKTAFAGVFTGLTQQVTTAFSALPSIIGGIFSQVQSVIAGIWSGIVATVTSFASQVVAAVGNFFGQIPGIIGGALASVVGTVTDAMAQVLSAVVTGAGQIVAEISSWPGKFVAALGDVGSLLVGSGRALVQGFANGIRDAIGSVTDAARSVVDAARRFFPFSPAKEGPFSGRGWVTYSGRAVGEGFADGIQDSTGGVVSTARAMMQAVKDVFGSAEGLTINFNLGAVAQQAQTATAAVKDFGNAIGTVPPAQLKSLQPEVSAQESQFTKDELDRQLAILEIERKSLEIERAKTGANEAAIKARLEEIKQQKLQLGLQKNQLDYATKYGEQTDSMATKMDDFYKDIGKKVVGLPTDFAKATGQQFMQDLGMSGEGAIPNLLREGAKYIFNVANIDDAMVAQQTAQRRDSLQFIQR
jgi:phage-related protein